MEKLVDTLPINDKGQLHGYHIYNGNSVTYEGNYINGKQQGIWLYTWHYGKNNDTDKFYYI